MLRYGEQERTLRNTLVFAGVVALAIPPLAVLGVKALIDEAKHPAPAWDMSPTPASASPWPEHPTPSILPNVVTSLPAVKLHEHLAKSTDPALRRLGARERQLDYRFDKNMLVTGFPRNPDEATAQATDMAKTLKEYARNGVKPLVLMAPTYDKGKTFPDLRTLSDSRHRQNYVDSMDAYFRTLNWAGVTDEQMGTWVPLPDPNASGWGGNTTDPAVFKRNYVPIAQAIKTHFRDAHVSLLLNDATYPSGDTHGAHPNHDAGKLLPYVSGIPDGLVDSLGYQGFPNQLGDDPAWFLPADSATTAAKRLGTRNIWFNTGTFSYNPNGDLHADSSDRAATFRGELNQAMAAQNEGFNVSVNVFAYGHDGGGGPNFAYGPSDISALRTGLQEAVAAQIPVSLYEG